MSMPSIHTSPCVGVSCLFFCCSSVLLPEPEAPMMATRSPCAIARLTSSNTSTVAGLSVLVLARWRQDTTGVSLIAQGLRGLGARGPPCRIERRDQTQEDCDAADAPHVLHVQVGRQLVDVIDLGGEELDAEEMIHRRHDGLDIQRDHDAAEDAEPRAD